MRTTWDNKELLQTLFHYSLDWKIHLIRLTNCNTEFWNFVISEKDDFENLLQNIERRVAYSARSFAKSSYSDVTKFRNAGLPMIQSQAD